MYKIILDMKKTILTILLVFTALQLFAQQHVGEFKVYNFDNGTGIVKMVLVGPQAEVDQRFYIQLEGDLLPGGILELSSYTNSDQMVQGSVPNKQIYLFEIEINPSEEGSNQIWYAVSGFGSGTKTSTTQASSKPNLF